MTNLIVFADMLLSASLAVTINLWFPSVVILAPLISFHKNQYPSPMVSISSTTLELLKWIKTTVGKGTIINKKNYNVERHKDSYTYYLKYNDVIELLKDIVPYLVIEPKKKRAQMIINGYKLITPRNGRYSIELLKLKEQFYEEFMQLK